VQDGDRTFSTSRPSPPLPPVPIIISAQIPIVQSAEARDELAALAADYESHARQAYEPNAKSRIVLRLPCSRKARWRATHDREPATATANRARCHSADAFACKFSPTAPSEITRQATDLSAVTFRMCG